MARTAKVKRARLNMRIPEPLLKWVKDYAGAHNTTVTQLFIDQLTDLQAKEEKVNAG